MSDVAQAKARAEASKAISRWWNAHNISNPRCTFFSAASLIEDVSEALDAFAAEQTAALRARVQAIEEADGEMPDDVWRECQTRGGATRVIRAAIAATKKEVLGFLADTERKP